MRAVQYDCMKHIPITSASTASKCIFLHSEWTFLHNFCTKHWWSNKWNRQPGAQQHFSLREPCTGLVDCEPRSSTGSEGGSIKSCCYLITHFLHESKPSDSPQHCEFYTKIKTWNHIVFFRHYSRCQSSWIRVFQLVCEFPLFVGCENVLPCGCYTM